MNGEEPGRDKRNAHLAHQRRAITWTLVAAFAWAVLHAILRSNVVSPSTLTIGVVIAVPLIAFVVAKPHRRS